MSKKGNHLNLSVGTKIKIGPEYANYCGNLSENEIITLIEGFFDYDNGLYCVTQNAPAIWEESEKEYSSIFHLFGNDLENFMDCEILHQ